jgi:4-carboxymuconolactone decarboxylase
MSDRPSRDELRRRGDDVLGQLGHGTNPPRARPLYLASIAGMEHYTSEALWGSVWSRPGLTLRLRILLTVSILAALQRLPQLRTYLNSALNAGLDVGELREVLIQCSAFGGFPATVNALELFRDVMEARGVSVAGGEANEVDLDQLAARGAGLQQRWFGEVPVAMSSERLEVAEVLAGLERSFVFGELFYRPGLDLPARAVCALAAVVALRMPADQRAWVAGCLRAGLGAEEIGEVVLQSAYYAGFPAANEAMRILHEFTGRGAGI